MLKIDNFQIPGYIEFLDLCLRFIALIELIHIKHAYYVNNKCMSVYGEVYFVFWTVWIQKRIKYVFIFHISITLLLLCCLIDMFTANEKARLGCLFRNTKYEYK